MDNEPIKSTELAKLCKERLEWSKTTTYTVIKRLSERGVIQNENTIVTSLISKEDLIGANGWHQHLTDENLANAEYIFDQGTDSALEAPCVLLYKDEKRDFALYYSFKSYAYEDWEDILIVSNGIRTVVKGAGAWERIDLRDTVTTLDLDHDGFAEIVARVITGYGTGYYQESLFVFDSTNAATYDQLHVCKPENIIYQEEIYEIKYLQGVTANLNIEDGSFVIRQEGGKEYTGHIKKLLEECPQINKVRWNHYTYVKMSQDGKLFFVALPCFWSDEFVTGVYVSASDMENDVCNIFYNFGA